MAFVISTQHINENLEAEFKGTHTYTVTLFTTGDNVIDTETITYDFASDKSISLASSVYFIVPSGTQVVRISLKDETDKVYLTETLFPQPIYTANGTYTINDIMVSFG